MPRKAKDIIAEAKKRFKQCVDAEATIRAKCLDDLIFLSGEQWSDQSLKERARDQRPALVVNRLDQFVQHIANAQRQNRISAKVFPVDDQGDIETAEVMQGMVRHIEYRSKGTLAYDTAEFYAVAMGFGYWRQITKYENPKTFKQEVLLERLPNPFQVYLGPHTLPDGSDAEFGFVFVDMPRDEFESEYLDADTKGLDDMRATGDMEGWLDEESVRVAEYYTKEYEPAKLVQLTDGQEKLRSELKPGEEKLIAIDEDGKPRERDTRIPTVKWYKLNAAEILDETEWPIDRIPIVKVIGHELTVNGKLILKGIVRNLKDAQRQYNFMLSAQTEAVDSSKGQVVMFEGQEEGHEQEWKNLNRQQVLKVKPTDLKGQPLPGPQRLAPNMSVAAMTEARMLAADDLKALTGVYDAALGARSNETSGRGILARQSQTETANFHFQDNLTLSVSHSTKMLVDLIGVVYDTPRMVRTIGEDDSQKVVRINQLFTEKGQTKKYDFTVGEYDVICTAGPAFQTKRQEGAQLLTQLASAAPILMQAAPDLIMKTLDVPYAQEISDRLKKTLPANLQDNPDQPEVPPQIQQKLQQMGQMLDVLTKELNAKNQLIEMKQVEAQNKLDIEHLHAETQITIAEINTKAQESKLRLQLEQDMWNQLHQQNHEAAMGAADHAAALAQQPAEPAAEQVSA